jgi:hypothetical protein
MNRPWQRRDEHRRQWAAESVQALCGAITTHCPSLTATDLRYLASVESWARGEATPQARQRHRKGLSPCLDYTVEDLLQDVGRHPEHLSRQVARALNWAAGASPERLAAIRGTYAARLAELRTVDPRVVALRAARETFERGAA